MAIMSSRLIRHQICKEELKKLGAKVLDIQGIMFYVKFILNDSVKLSYIYHLNPDNTYFLERVKPYSMAIGEYDTEEDIVDTIRVDHEQFQNAMNSKNFVSFIEIDNKISKLVRIFEDLYLYYNIDTDDLTLLNDGVYNMLEIIKGIQSRSERVYYKKDPDILKDDINF
ncbi:MAG: hypothetical protein JXO44_07425 [Clostridia bacterium]|nr:hypothetical protein [Clostridia bacterium]